MKKSQFTEAEIVNVLKDADSGMSVSEVCRKHGITNYTFYKWRKAYRGLDVKETKRMKELEAENQKLKRLVANLSLDNLALKDVLTKK